MAPAGTVAVICESESTEYVALVPSKRTLVAPVNPVPVSTTCVPTGPLAGLNPVTAGAVAANAPDALTTITTNAATTPAAAVRRRVDKM